MCAPCTICAAIYAVFAQRGTMTAIHVAKLWFILRPHTRPRRTTAPMTYQAQSQCVIFTEIPHNKTLYARG